MSDAGRLSEAFFRDRYSLDPTVAADLLGVAMSRGGDHAELFFEHREGSNITFEQHAVKAASRSTTQGVGVRVHPGRRHRLRVHRGSVPRRDAPGGGHGGAHRIARRHGAAGRRGALRVGELLRARRRARSTWRRPTRSS